MTRVKTSALTVTTTLVKPVSQVTAAATTPGESGAEWQQLIRYTHTSSSSSSGKRLGCQLSISQVVLQVTRQHPSSSSTQQQQQGSSHVRMAQHLLLVMVVQQQQQQQPQLPY